MLLYYEYIPMYFKCRSSMDKIEIITSEDNFFLRKLVPLFVFSRLLVFLTNFLLVFVKKKFLDAGYKNSILSVYMRSCGLCQFITTY